jgi:hypothetical protein
VVLEGLVDAGEIDAVAEDLHLAFPTSEEYHADSEGVTRQWLGTRGDPTEEFAWPDEGPGFRGEQHRWGSVFPFAAWSSTRRSSTSPSGPLAPTTSVCTRPGPAQNTPA